MSDFSTQTEAMRYLSIVGKREGAANDRRLEAFFGLPPTDPSSHEQPSPQSDVTLGGKAE